MNEYTFLLLVGLRVQLGEESCGHLITACSDVEKHVWITETKDNENRKQGPWSRTWSRAVLVRMERRGQM